MKVEVRGTNPALDPFSDENLSPDADQLDRIVWIAMQLPQMMMSFKEENSILPSRPTKETRNGEDARTAAPRDHAGYKPGRDIDRRPQGHKNDYEDMTGKNLSFFFSYFINEILMQLLK